MERNPIRLALRLLSRLMAYRSPKIQVPPPRAILRDVTIVNPGQDRLYGQTLVVEGDRIARISPTVQQGAVKSDDAQYAGSYILPGLIDMHAHIGPPIRELFNLLFLAHGVTTVRETGDADGTTWRGRERIQAGKVPGPRIYASGPVLDGHPPFLPTSWTVRNEVQARAAVAKLAAHGADLIKIHHKLSPEALDGIRQAAAEQGLPVVGHVPASVPFEAAGVWDVQHLDGLVPYPQPPETALDYQKRWRDLDPARISFYVQTSVEQRLVHTPTLLSSTALIWAADPDRAPDPGAQFLPRFIREVAWDRESMPLFCRFSDQISELMKQAEKRSKEVVQRLHEAGVRIHLGTDVGMPLLIPGLSVQQELKLVVEAGLSIEGAWEAGTRAAGESLGVPLLGTVQEDAPADLLIFGQDPSRNLSALSTLQAVVAQGRLYSRAFLDRALARHRQRFEQPLYDSLSTAMLRLGMRAMVPKD
jgi:cytosine/adenosine deaminase-related metal-dependent hydrolase